jgi:hypothetical protein
MKEFLLFGGVFFLFNFISVGGKAAQVGSSNLPSTHRVIFSYGTHTASWT